MTTLQATLLGVVAVLAFWTLGGYNRLVAMRNDIGAAWLQVEVPLMQRGELIVGLVERLRSVLVGEHRALDAVLATSVQVGAAALAVRPRPVAVGPIAGLVHARAEHAAAMARLLALIEQQAARPDDHDVHEQVAALESLEPKLDFASQWFNDAVRRYNEAAQEFPTRILAWMFDFGAAATL